MLINTAPLRRPECFSDDDSWRQYLLSCHETHVPVARRDDRIKGGVRTTQAVLLPTPRIPYCKDCNASWQALMRAQGRCHPVKIERDD